MCLGCSKEPSQRDSSFEYPQYMFWLRNNNMNFVDIAKKCIFTLAKNIYMFDRKALIIIIFGVYILCIAPYN